jgi:hypothetical protein
MLVQALKEAGIIRRKHMDCKPRAMDFIFSRRIFAPIIIALLHQILEERMKITSFYQGFTSALLKTYSRIEG